MLRVKRVKRTTQPGGGCGNEAIENSETLAEMKRPIPLKGITGITTFDVDDMDTHDIF